MTTSVPNILEPPATRRPNFRGDSGAGLLSGSIWCVFLGVIPFATPIFDPVMIFWCAALCACAAFLFRRYLIFRRGIGLLLTPEGFLQFPRTRPRPPLLPWRPDLDIRLTRRKGRWELTISRGFTTPVDAALPTLTDADIDNLRETLHQWTIRPVYIERIS